MVSGASWSVKFFHLTTILVPEHGLLTVVFADNLRRRGIRKIYYCVAMSTAPKFDNFPQSLISRTTKTA
jgi:hypothetical protein